MQFAGVSRSARQTDTYQTDRNTKLPLYNSTRFTTPFYRNTRLTNRIGFLMVMSRVNYAGVRQQRRAAPLQRKVRLPPSSFNPHLSYLPLPTSAPQVAHVHAFAFAPLHGPSPAKATAMAHRPSHPPQTIRYPYVLFDQLAQEGEAPACADLSPVLMRAEERASKRLRASATLPLAFRS